MDMETERLVERVARRRKQTRSQVVREAIAQLAREETSGGGRAPFESIAHLIGCVRGGPPDLSRRTGDKLKALLRERERRRR